MREDIEEGTEEVFQEERLTLLPGGRLEFVWLDTECDAVQIADVTEDAVAFLFTPLRLAADLRLGDIFLLLRQSAELVHIFSRDGAADLLDEVFGGEAPPYTDEYDPLGIEYLELSQGWQIETRKKTEAGHTKVVRNEIQGNLPQLNLHGIGFPLRAEDAPEHGRSVDERIAWALELAPPRSLFHTPLRLKRALTVHEHIQHSLKRHENLVHVYSYRNGWPLGVILHLILGTFSVFGDKNERAATRQLLSDRLAEFDVPSDQQDNPGANQNNP